MVSRLDPVLGTTDLPLAELCAARLDGEVLACADSFLMVDAPDTAEVRASLAHAGRGDRVIVERRSAAWVHGALAMPPAVHHLCVSTAARTRRPLAGLREVRFDEGDLVLVGGVAVTSPLRTVLDLVRSAEDDEHAADRSALRALLHVAGIAPEQAAARLDARRKLPGKERALRRLRALPQPAETRYTS